MKLILRVSVCIVLAGCAGPTNPELEKPTAEILRRRGHRESEIPQILKWNMLGWERSVLRPGSGATPKQIREAKTHLELRTRTMIVQPSHDLDSMPPAANPEAEMFNKDRVTFDCEMLSLTADGKGRHVAALRLKGMNDAIHCNEFFVVKPSINSITVTGSKLNQVPLPNQNLCVTISPEGKVVMVNFEPSDGLGVVGNIVKLPDRRYQVTDRKVVVDHLVDWNIRNTEDQFEGYIDFFSLSSNGWTIWNFEKGPGGSDLSWLTSKGKRGAFD